ncbi:MAG TPA: helix-hairpin-helix domain-containing protein [Flavisolibacter sp.]
MFRKKWIRDYLTFSRRDRVGIMALVFLVAAAYYLPLLFPKPAPVTLQELHLAKEQLDSLPAPAGTAMTEDVFTSGPTITGQLFDFDPNTLDADGWRRLGLREKTIGTILKYRAKGGRFRQPGDLAKIWGLPPGFYERVREHVRIAEAPGGYPRAIPGTRKQEMGVINVNTADSTQLVALPGIGPALASRIIGFRNRLGGFYSVDQVRETYGLPDSVFVKLAPRLSVDGNVNTININTATKEELKQHPYVRWKLANAIVEYRNQHGNFTETEQLKKIAIITDEQLRKLAPYVQL